jgi:hypothetical protein
MTKTIVSNRGETVMVYRRKDEASYTPLGVGPDDEELKRFSASRALNLD